MQIMLAGFATLVLTVVLFVLLLPRHGKTHRFVDTELEPYIAVARQQHDEQDNGQRQRRESGHHDLHRCSSPGRYL